MTRSPSASTGIPHHFPVPHVSQEELRQEADAAVDVGHIVWKCLDVLRRNIGLSVTALGGSSLDDLIEEAKQKLWEREIPLTQEHVGNIQTAVRAWIGERLSRKPSTMGEKRIA